VCTDARSGQSDGAKRRGHSGKPINPERKSRKQRAVDLGRALRSVYDDTLREIVEYRRRDPRWWLATAATLFFALWGWRELAVRAANDGGVRY